MIYCQTGGQFTESLRNTDKDTCRLRKKNENIEIPENLISKTPIFQDYNNFYILLRKTGLEPVRKQYALDP